MRPSYFLALVLPCICVLVSCNEKDDPAPYVDPRYAEMNSVTAITSTSATFTLKIKRPVTKVADGYLVDGMYFDDYTFMYSTDPDQNSRYWQMAQEIVRDDSGSYSLTVGDLEPGTRYYVKAVVVIAPRVQQQVNWSISASVLEFETPE